MKVGLFFGSFNPIHIGHTLIANYFAEFTDLNRVWLVISPHNPLKEKKTLLADHHRCELAYQAIKDSKTIKLSKIELSLPQPSYTIDTLTYLSEKYPDHIFSIIMGADNLLTFHKWKNYKEILKHYKIYVYPRPGIDISRQKEEYNATIVDAPLIEISSGFIRQSIKDGKDVRFFMPNDSYNYMKEMHFYEK